MRLPRTLFGRLLLVFILFGAVMTGALLIVMQVSHRLYHLEFDQTINRELARNYVQSNFLLTDVPLTVSTLHRGIGKLAAANPAVDIYLLENDGSIVASSVPERNWRRTRVGMGPVHEFLAGNGAPILADDPRDATREGVFSAAPFHIADCPADFLYLVLRGGEHQPGAARLRTRYAVGEGAAVILTAAVLAVGLSLFFLRLLTRRLGVLETAIRGFRDAHGIRAPAPDRPGRRPGGDEVDRLEALFNDLTARIEEQMETLKATDVMRRDTLANVSHDLRTPLTTLLTHLETLQMKGLELPEDERAEYLRVAMRQSRRIGLLVEQLLEAARLDAGQVVVNAEPFPIGELLQDVLQKFSLAAQERGVDLQAEILSASDVVRGDIALLERVLDNLIANALRHAPAGGRVTVSARRRGDCVRVAVGDTGPGLTPDEARRVFDRFYRVDPGRSSASGQLGLGLAIVKSILDMHGCTVAVDSRPGSGTSFWFELPVLRG
ncbi:MAG: HAMP domain-containing histidine kinase [Gammaproteobacteria bacterium]|nr:MAG: HAMP domain-containing histidine kinase [Gammaproteobacteria bacterium]